MKRSKYRHQILFFLWLVLLCGLNRFCFAAKSGETPAIFPLVQEIKFTDSIFRLDEQTQILVPAKPGEQDLFLARFLVAELSDRYGIALQVSRLSAVPSRGNIIVMGSLENPLVKAYCKKHAIEVTPQKPGPEGYVLQVSERMVLIAGSDQRGAFYGLQSLRQLIKKDNQGVSLPGVQVRDWPNMPFRAIRLYIPGTDNMPFFRRFLRDFMALYKFNKVIIEVNCMRLDRHPEVNAGWIEFAKYMKYTRQSEPRGIHGQSRNSGHQDAGDGAIVEKQDVRELVRFARENFIEVIPEIPSLTHGYYLLTRHPELAEYSKALWPDTYCPSNPKSYELLFDVFDEYIEVINPKMIHIGHDEWWGAPLGFCPRCKNKEYGQLFAQDINKIHDYLAQKGIKIAMWGDHLLEDVRGKGLANHTSPTGFKYQTAGGLSSEIVKESIPKDILIFNWFWGQPENDVVVDKFGFQQIYGNFKPNIADWQDRIKKINVIGGAPSSWVATTEFNIGKDLLYDFLGCANLLWSNRSLEQTELIKAVWRMMPTVRRNLSGRATPSEDGERVAPVDIAPWLNIGCDDKLSGVELAGLRTGRVNAGNKVFKLADAGGKRIAAVVANGDKESTLVSKIEAIKIGRDVSSLIFLQACTKPAGNQKGYFCIFNTPDSADLLGWYEVVYEDGFVEVVPIRYGVNILEYDAGSEKSLDKRKGETGSAQNSYCYGADAVDCSHIGDSRIVFFAYEWENKRYGKRIKQVNLKGAVDYQALEQVYSKVVTSPARENKIMLLALSVVEKSMPPAPID